MARQALRAFAGEDPVVVPSGSCAAMVRHGYPELFAGTPEEDAAASMAERTVELTQFLAREGPADGRRGHRLGDLPRLLPHAAAAAGAGQPADGARRASAGWS